MKLPTITRDTITSFSADGRRTVVGYHYILKPWMVKIFPNHPWVLPHFHWTIYISTLHMGKVIIIRYSGLYLRQIEEMMAKQIADQINQVIGTGHLTK